MVEASAPQCEPSVGVNDTRIGDCAPVHPNQFLSGRRVTQPVEVLLTARRIVNGHETPAPVESQAQDHTGQTEAMVAVEVGDADSSDRRRRDVGERQLALRALAWVEQNAFAVPAQQVSIVVAVTGRRLARGSQNNQFAFGHFNGLPRPNARSGT